jgi:hypothetical protein
LFLGRGPGLQGSTFIGTFFLTCGFFSGLLLLLVQWIFVSLVQKLLLLVQKCRDNVPKSNQEATKNM